MALVKPTLIDPIQPGKRGSVVLYQRGGRMVARRVQRPVNGRTTFQLEERNAIAQASKTWRWNLTEPEQIAWRDSSHIVNNGSVNIQGTNSTAVYAIPQFVTLRAAQANPSVPTLLAFTYDQDPFDLMISVDVAVGGPNTTMNVLATRPRSPGRRPAINDLRYIATIDPNAGLVDLTIPYTSRFPTEPQLGQPLGLALTAYDPDSPAYSTRSPLIIIPSSYVPIACSIDITLPIAVNELRATIVRACNLALPFSDVVTFTTSAARGTSIHLGDIPNCDPVGNTGIYTAPATPGPETLTLNTTFSDASTCQSVLHFNIDP